MKIIDHDFFKKIQNREVDVPNDTVILFKGCGPATPVFGSRSYDIVFRNCKVALFDNTDKEFNFYWINSIAFPKIEKIYFFVLMVLLQNHIVIEDFTKMYG